MEDWHRRRQIISFNKLFSSASFSFISLLSFTQIRSSSYFAASESLIPLLDSWFSGTTITFHLFIPFRFCRSPTLLLLLYYSLNHSGAELISISWRFSSTSSRLLTMPSCVQAAFLHVFLFVLLLVTRSEKKSECHRASHSLHHAVMLGLESVTWKVGRPRNCVWVWGHSERRSEKNMYDENGGTFSFCRSTCLTDSNPD